MTDADIIQKKQNDEAHTRYLAYLLTLRQRGQMTRKMYLEAVEGTYEPFDNKNKPHQTWTMLCNLAYEIVGVEVEAK